MWPLISSCSTVCLWNFVCTRTVFSTRQGPNAPARTTQRLNNKLLSVIVFRQTVLWIHIIGKQPDCILWFKEQVKTAYCFNKISVAGRCWFPFIHWSCTLRQFYSPCWQVDSPISSKIVGKLKEITQICISVMVTKTDNQLWWTHEAPLVYSWQITIVLPSEN